MMAVECVIYVSTAWGTSPSNVSRTTAIWESGKFSDDSIKREWIAIAACSGRKIKKCSKHS